MNIKIYRFAASPTVRIGGITYYSPEIGMFGYKDNRVGRESFLDQSPQAKKFAAWMKSRYEESKNQNQEEKNKSN